LSLVYTVNTVTEQGPYFTYRTEIPKMRQETVHLAVTRITQ